MTTTRSETEGRAGSTAVATAPRAARSRGAERIGPPPAPAGSGRSAAANGRVPRTEVIFLFNQLDVMLDTGVPIADALQSIAHRTTDPRLGGVLDDVTNQVQAGESFSNAVARHPRAFRPIVVALLRAGEAGGSMPTMLNRLASYLTKEHQTLRQVRSALMYPAFMLFMCLSIAVVLLTVVMPRFTSIYASRDAVLPGPTRFLMGISNGMIDHWIVLLGATCFTIAGLVVWTRTQAGRAQIDWLKLSTPLISDLTGKLNVSRACRTIATMLESGVPMLEVVSIVRGVTPNAYFGRLWDRVDDDLRNGKRLSDSLYESPLMPQYVTQMIESGENAGRLGKVFSRVADFAESEYDQAVKTAIQYIEPVMIITMGGIIGFVAIALLIPVFGAGHVVSGG